jgi:hypothetical protein
MSIVFMKYMIPIPKGKSVKVVSTDDTEIYDVTSGRSYTITNMILQNNGVNDITLTLYDGSSSGTVLGIVLCPAKSTIIATELIGREAYDDITADATTGTPDATNYVSVTVNGYER